MSKLRVYKGLILLFLSTSTITLAGCNRNICDNILLQTTDKEVDDIDEEINIDLQLEELNKNYEKISEEKKEKKIYYNNKYGYLKENTTLKRKNKKNSKIIVNIEMYEKVELIEKNGKWTLVKYNDKKGYIKTKEIKVINEAFFDVDISDQTMTYYNKKGEEIIKSAVVTGNYRSNDTNKGCHRVLFKMKNVTLRGSDYVTPVTYWIPFNNSGEGLHDAYWRCSDTSSRDSDDINFGGEIYKGNGSHGCVNLPPKVAEKVYKKAKKGRIVLVHE